MALDHPQPALAQPPGTAPYRRRITRQRAARLLVVTALLLLGGFVLWDFLPALVWAAILAIATWPLYRRFLAQCPARARRVVAPLVFTLAIGLIFIVPLAIGAIEMGREARVAVTWVATAQRTGFPVPEWVPRLPVIGAQAATWWQENLSDPDAATELLGRVNRTVLGEWTRALGVKLVHGLTIFAFTLLTLFFLYRDGVALTERLLRLSDRLLGHRGERLALVAIAAVHGTVTGLVLVGLGEGVLIGIGYVVTGVPHPVMFGALTGILAAIPFAAPIVFGAASLVLLAEGNTAAAIGLFAFAGAVVFIADHFIRPVLIGGAVRLPFLWVLLGILGGIESFGLLGIFLGPAILAVLITLWREWTERPAPAATATPE
jgi:predicted PurR-regulated permease PerM